MHISAYEFPYHNLDQISLRYASIYFTFWSVSVVGSFYSKKARFGFIDTAKKARPQANLMSRLLFSSQYRDERSKIRSMFHSYCMKGQLKKHSSCHNLFKKDVLNVISTLLSVRMHDLVANDVYDYSGCGICMSTISSSCCTQISATTVRTYSEKMWTLLFIVVHKYH